MTKRYSILISISLIIFIALMVMLCWNSRLATDDFWYIWNVNNFGIITGVKNQYMEWCGRYVSEFSRDVMYWYFQYNQRLYFFFPLLTLVLLISGANRALDEISHYLQFYLPRFERRIASTSFVALLFFLSTDKGESWFWYNALNDYLLSIVALLWGVSFLLQDDETILNYLGLILCTIYVGGGSEVYTSVIGLAMVLFIINHYRQSNNTRLLLPQFFNRKMFVFLIVLGISFAIVVMAPGNYARATLLPPSRFFYSFFIVAKSFVKLFFVFLPLQLPYILAFSVPFVLVGQVSKAYDLAIFSQSFKSYFIKITAWLIGFLFVFFFIVAYLMVETGPARVWLFASFMVAVYLSMLAFYVGHMRVLNKKRLVYLQWASIVCALGFTIFHLVNQSFVTSRYAAAIDSRNLHMIELNKTIHRDTVIKLEPLPPRGMLYSSEIESDTNHFTNKEMRLGFNLNYHVVVEKNEK